MQSRKKQSGMVLIEWLVVGVLIAIASVAAYNTLARETTVTESSQMRDALVNLFAKVKAVKSQWGDYNGYTNASFYLSDELLPASMKSTAANQFVTPYSENGLTFLPVSTVTNINGQTFNGTDGWLSVVIRNIPEGNCVDEVKRYLDKVIQVNVGSTRIDGQAALDAACGAASGTINITVIGG